MTVNHAEQIHAAVAAIDNVLRTLNDEQPHPVAADPNAVVRLVRAKLLLCDVVEPRPVSDHGRQPVSRRSRVELPDVVKPAGRRDPRWPGLVVLGSRVPAAPLSD